MEIVGEAQNATEALDLICRESPDVLFTDIQMPGTDGIGLSELALKKFPEIHGNTLPMGKRIRAARQSNARRLLIAFLSSKDFAISHRCDLLSSTRQHQVHK